MSTWLNFLALAIFVNFELLSLLHLFLHHVYIPSQLISINFILYNICQCLLSCDLIEFLAFISYLSILNCLLQLVFHHAWGFVNFIVELLHLFIDDIHLVDLYLYFAGLFNCS